MLEKPPDDALDVDVLGEVGNAGPQAANAAHDEIDFDASLARLVQRVDDLGVDQEFIFIQMAAGRPAWRGTSPRGYGRGCAP
jgi:hypothetical protein